MKQQTLNLINDLKNNEQDYEFYPTTQEIIDCISESLQGKMRASWLDIGAGNGGFYEKYTKTNPEGIYSYAIIEKSDILRNELNKTLQEKCTNLERSVRDEANKNIILESLIKQRPNQNEERKLY